MDRGKVMVLNGEEGLECEVYVDWIRLKYVSEFKYLGCVLNKSGTDGVECSRKMVSGKRVAGAIRSLVNVRDLKLECARFLQETLLVPVLMYGIKTTLGKRSRDLVMAVEMDNFRGLFGIRKIHG